MRTIVLILAAIGLAFWSLLAWAASGLIGVAGDFAASNSIYLPLPPELVFWAAGLMSGAGGAVVWIVWGIGALLIVLVTMLLLALLARLGRQSPEPAYTYPADPVVRVTPQIQTRAGGETRSAEEIVARVIGKPPQQ